MTFVSRHQRQRQRQRLRQRRQQLRYGQGELSWNSAKPKKSNENFAAKWHVNKLQRFVVCWGYGLGTTNNNNSNGNWNEHNTCPIDLRLLCGLPPPLPASSKRTTNELTFLASLRKSLGNRWLCPTDDNFGPSSTNIRISPPVLISSSCRLNHKIHLLPAGCCCCCHYDYCHLVEVIQCI